MVWRCSVICLSALILIPLVTAQHAAAQGMIAPKEKPVDDRRFDSMNTYAPKTLIIYGRVAMPDGSPPAQLVMVERVCKGITQAGGFTDSKGRFSFDLGVLTRALMERSIIDSQSSSQTAPVRINPEDLMQCEVRATLSGYRSQSLPLASVASGNKSQLGTIVLNPLGKERSPAVSESDLKAPKNARQAFDKGLDDAAQAKWPDAIKEFEKAASLYPQYSSAWFSLGMLQAGSNNISAALQSYSQAMTADENFALPYIESAVLENNAKRSEKVLELTRKVIKISPGAFPNAYLLSAWANLRLQLYDECISSAAEGIKLDEEHHFPDLEFVAGLALLAKRDAQGAAEKLQAYLTLAPLGSNAGLAQRQLESIRSGSIQR